MTGAHGHLSSEKQMCLAGGQQPSERLRQSFWIRAEEIHATTFTVDT